VAGVIDPGETAEQAAIREAQEEAGVAIRQLEVVTRAYPSSGALAEFIHVFVGLCDLSDLNGGGGMAGEGEDIRSEIISYDTLMQRVDEQAYKDLPLMICALWLSRHRERLRAMHL
jgi:8-oxo-dGTP pyrophosphatase MutT (NUDIX family)